jgi:phytoene desaturase
MLMRTDSQGRPSSPHAVVIGCGVGGLAAGARLAAKGYRVTMLDKLDGPGGRAYTYRQDGFTFDAGPTIITAPYVFEDLWQACGRRLSDDVELKPCDPFYKIRFDDGSMFSYCADRERMRAEVARFNPADVAGYDRFMEASQKIFEVAFEELADKPFHSLAFTMRTMADLVRLGGYRSVFSKVKDYFTDPRLQVVFSFHPLLIGGNPFTTTSYYCLIAHLESKYGVHYAEGGTGALVKAMADLVTGQGGDIRYGAEVVRILPNRAGCAGLSLRLAKQLQPTLWFQTPILPGRTASSCSACRASAGVTASSSAPTIR